MKILELKILNRYSVKESNNFDMKIYVKFIEGFWFWKKITEQTVYRHNPVMPLSKLRWMSPTCPDTFYYKDGTCLKNSKAELLAKTLRDIKNRQDKIQRKRNITDDLITLL